MAVNMSQLRKAKKQNLQKPQQTKVILPIQTGSGKKCWVTIKFEDQEDTLTFVSDDCKIDLDKRVDGYFVIHGFLSEEG